MEKDEKKNCSNCCWMNDNLTCWSVLTDVLAIEHPGSRKDIDRIVNDLLLSLS